MTDMLISLGILIEMWAVVELLRPAVAIFLGPAAPKR